MLTWRQHPQIQHKDWIDDIKEGLGIASGIIDLINDHERDKYNAAIAEYSRKVDQESLKIYLNTAKRDADFLRRDADILRARASGADFDAAYHTRQSEWYTGQASQIRESGRLDVAMYEDRTRADIMENRAGLEVAK